jgi:hypothetical protein
MECEWWHEFCWIESVWTVKVDQVTEVEDGLEAELVQGAEANVGDEWKKTLKDIKVDSLGKRFCGESVDVLSLQTGNGIDECLVQILEDGDVIGLFTSDFL